MKVPAVAALVIVLLVGLPAALLAPVPAGPIEWYIPTVASQPPYANGTAVVGDTVTYQWNSFHGVVLSSSSNCSARQLFQPVPGGAEASSGMANVTFSTPGVVYVICPVGPHCRLGQIQEWTVSAS